MSQQATPAKPSTIPLDAATAFAIAFTVNHPHLFEGNDDTFNHLMDVYQDQIPHQLIDSSLWWFCHYWSNGHTCSKCLEIANLFPHGEPVTDQHFDAMTQHMTSGHADACSARTACSFSGLKTCVAFFCNGQFPVHGNIVYRPNPATASFLAGDLT